MPTIVDPNTGQTIQLPYGDEGGAPPPGPPMGGPPPELLAMLAGAQGAPPGAAPGGPPPMPEGPQFKDPAEALRDLFQLVQSHPYLQMESDDADLAQLQKILSSMQDLLAKNQKQAESAMGVGPAQKFLMKQTAGQGV